MILLVIRKKHFFKAWVTWGNLRTMVVVSPSEGAGSQLNTTLLESVIMRGSQDEYLLFGPVCGWLDGVWLYKKLERPIFS